jgi:hypothetical protein
MAANPIHKWPAPDVRAKAAAEIRGRWLEIIDGLIEAAIRGNVRAFLVLREEAWGTPISGVKQNPAAISLEEIMSEDEGMTLLLSQMSKWAKGGL